jgi:hypothetical protein
MTTTFLRIGSCDSLERDARRTHPRLGGLRLGLAAVTALALSAHASAQIAETKLLAPDGGQQDNFGWAVATSPGWAFCTAPGDDDVLNASGAIYAFQDTGSGWTFAQKLKAAVPALQVVLGQCVAASGPWMVAGAPIDAPFGGAYCGSAEVFHLESGVWVHSQKLVPSDHETAYHMAASADLSGDRMALGAPDDFTASGSVYVFELSGSSWVQVAKLSAPEVEIFSRFGFAVALDGDTLVAGAPYASFGVPNSYLGAVFVFERVGASWQFQQKLVASDPHEDDSFGRSVAIDGDRIVVGSYHDHTAAGAGGVYVFERQAGVWSQTAELLESDPSSQFDLGACVDIQGDLAVTSGLFDNDHGSNSGSAYVFRRNGGGGWLQIAKAIAPDAMHDTQFGNAVALLGSRVLIGAQYDDWVCPGNPFACNAGSAYVFELAPQAVQYGSCPTQGPCGNHDDFGGCSCSSGTGGELAAAGSSSVSADDLHFEARWMPANKLGLFFMGGMPTSVPFGDGQLCVASGGAGIWRFNPAQSSGPLGVMTLGPGVVGLSNSLPPGGHIQAGQIWHFQAWFRDPAGPCGQGSNMTNAVRVMFEP